VPALGCGMARFTPGERLPAAINHVIGRGRANCGISTSVVPRLSICLSRHNHVSWRPCALDGRYGRPYLSLATEIRLSAALYICATPATPE
jgi:hypothetical protein